MSSEADKKVTCPTKYTPEMIEKAQDYADNFTEAPYNELIPSIAGLALALGLSRSTVYDWSNQKEKTEISYIVKQLMQKQEILLFSAGLTGNYNASITKLMLTKHGYNDKVDTDVTSGGKEISNNFIIQPVTNKDNG